MRLVTRSYDTLPAEVLGYTIYAISTTKPQRYRDMPVLWLFAPTFDMQIEYNLSKDQAKFNERMAAALKQRASAIEDWVKANSDAKICLACWEGVDSCHRGLVAERIKQAAEKAGISVTTDIG